MAALFLAAEGLSSRICRQLPRQLNVGAGSARSVLQANRRAQNRRAGLQSYSPARSRLGRSARRGKERCQTDGHRPPACRRCSVHVAYAGLRIIELAPVPPPARGWPRVLRLGDRRRVGSPARAGMAPARMKAPCSCVRFPRPRGDGPHCTIKPVLVPRVPPPARGWPRRGSAIHDQAEGSPARAGMAPCKSWSTASKPRFPRPRGDGPRISAGNVVTALVPPPARGWPREGAHGRLRADGSPARAGMAPSSAVT